MCCRTLAAMIRDTLIDALGSAIEAAGVDPRPASIALERPAHRDHGDWSSNVALATAKTVGKNPRELAQQVVAELQRELPLHVEAIEIAGPGFINFRLAHTWLHDVLADVIATGQGAFGRHSFGSGTHINVEFVSANPNKPLHAGHARGAVYGDSVARLLEATGHQVTRESYLNDRGVQMSLFADSLAARKRGEAPPDDGYQGDYLIDWADEMPDDSDPLEWGYERAVRSHQETLARVNVNHDVWFSERSLVAGGQVAESLAQLRAREMAFDNDDATWLKSTVFGDDKDRVLIKSDGDFTYLMPDIAYHRDKFARADKLINVWGADHHGYIVRMKAAVGALGNDPDDLEIIVTQLVELNRDGVEVRMSGRLGDMVTFDEVIDEIGADAARFTFLSQSMDTRQSVDLAALSAKSMDNPVYYVQYAHARIHSLMRKAAEAGFVFDASTTTDLSPLVAEREHEVIRTLSEFAEIVEIAARERAPHKIVNWLRELAAAFHGFYHDCYVIGDGISSELTNARLALIEATRIGLGAGLDLVGVSAPEAM